MHFQFVQNNNNGIKIRDAYSDFFMGAGAVSFQWKKALNNDF